MLSHGLRYTGIYILVSLEESPFTKVLTEEPVTVVDQIEVAFATGTAHDCNAKRD